MVRSYGVRPRVEIGVEKKFLHVINLPTSNQHTDIMGCLGHHTHYTIESSDINRDRTQEL